MKFVSWPPSLTGAVRPLLASLRAEPRYIEMREEMRSRVNSMHQNVSAAQEADDWSELRARAGTDLSASAR